MPELDGTQIAAMASFAALILAWLVAPAAPEAGAEQEPLPAAA